MLKRNFYLMSFICLFIIFSTNSFGQSNKRKRMVKTKSTTARTISPSKTEIVKKSLKEDENGDGDYSDRGETKITRKTSPNLRHRPAKPAANVQSDFGGLDPTDEQPEFGSGERTAPPKRNIFLEGGNDSWNTRKKTGRKRKVISKKGPTKTQNLLPYMEQSNIIQKAKRKPKR